METKSQMLERYVKLRICQQSLDDAMSNMAIADGDGDEKYSADQDSACMNLDDLKGLLAYPTDELRDAIIEPEYLPPIGTIGWAVMRMQDGARVTRYGWNGKDMYLEMQRPDEHSKMTLPYIYMKTVQGDLVPWLCSQTDLLADDWEEYAETL